MHACLNKYVCDRSAAHSAQWQDLELIFHRHLQHGNRLERRKGVAYASLRPAETFMCACLRPTEAACFRVRKCVNNRQLIDAGIERFVRRIRSLLLYHIHKQNKVCDTYIYANTDGHNFHTRKRCQACVSYMMMISVFLRWTPSLSDHSKLKGECTDVN